MRHWCQRNALALCFVSMTIFYVIGKILGSSTIYPVSILLVAAFAFRPAHLRPYCASMASLVVLAAYSWLVAGVRPPLLPLAGLAVNLFLIAFLWNHRDEKTDTAFLAKFLAGITTVLWVFGILGLAVNFENLRPYLGWDNIIGTALRTINTQGLREQLVYSTTAAWSSDKVDAKWVVSLADIILLISACFITRSSSRMKWFVLLALALFSFTTFSRGSLVGAFVLTMMGLCPKAWRWLRRPLILSFTLIPVVFCFGSSSFLNGRLDTWDAIRRRSTLEGNGIGGGRELANWVHENAYKTKLDVVQNPHSIHLETIFDFGWILYFILAAAVVWYLWRVRAWRTSWMLFFVCAVNYTIYSPWTVWLVFFALFADLQESLENPGVTT